MKLDGMITEQQAWVESELIGHLQQLIRLDSRTERAQETQVARYLTGQMTEAGIRCEWAEPVPGKGSMVAFFDGEAPQEPALLLLAHTDTAGWEGQQWKHPPLSGVYQDGTIWGRGAVDCKGLAVVWLVLLLLAAKCGLRPRRPLLFAAVADEETGGQYGTGWLLEHTQLLKQVGFVLGEGGGYPVFFGGRRYVTCQTGEQEASVAKPSGSSPFFGGYYNTDVVSEFCRRVVAGQKRSYRWLAARPGLRSWLLSRLQAAAPVRTDVAALFRSAPLPATDCDTELFRLLARYTPGGVPEEHVLPYVTPGCSDNRFFRAKGIPTYGFFPLGDEQTIRTIHQANERIRAADLTAAFWCLFAVVSSFCELEFSA